MSRLMWEKCFVFLVFANSLHLILAVSERSEGTPGCECAVRAHVGFRNPTCTCVARVERGFLVDSIVQMLELEEKLEAVKQQGCSCQVQTDPGYRSGSCSCDATFVECPPNSSGHPNCLPVQGYHGAVRWNVAKEVYEFVTEEGTVVDALPVRDCPAHSEGWPTCGCVKGFSGKIEWNSNSNQYDGKCTLAECPANGENAPECRCKKGYAETETLLFDMKSQSWVGACTKVDCTGDSDKITHPTCSCSLGFAGKSTWDASAGQWESSCTQASCPARATHTASNTCECNKGYFDADTDPIRFSFATQEWLGACQKRECPDKTKNDHPTCSCAVGYLGKINWNAAEEIFDGKCNLAPCPDGGFGQDCACGVGYVSSPLTGPVWLADQGWQHTCTLKGCPEGANPNNPTACKCDLPGYDGGLLWTGQDWGVCRQIPCPVHSFPILDHKNQKDCACEIGFSGDVVWNEGNQDWTSGCTEVACPNHASCSTIKSFCLQGYSKTVSWNPDTQLWDSHCTIVKCPEGSRNHPNCACLTGWAGGDANGLLNWIADGDNSKWESGCKEISCPAHADKGPDGTCTCKFGYFGEVTWKNPAYEGTCQPAPCPENASGDGPTCACPKGFLATEDFGFQNGAWLGKCVKTPCPGQFSENFPDCKCQRGARTPLGGTVLNWNPKSGWDATCNVVPCPANSGPQQDCSCNTGYATTLQGQVVSNGPAWDASVGAWNHLCKKIECPLGADPTQHPNCACKVGFRGHPEWDSKTGTWTTCVAVPCRSESNLIRASNQVEENECVCRVGYVGKISWLPEPQDWTGSCETATCPPNSVCRESEAACAKGYKGSVTWEPSGWKAECTMVQCPPNSEGHPDCTCQIGYAGQMLSWNGESYGTCTYVPCPANSIRLETGNCQCDKFYKGVITWIGNSYEGTCALATCPEHGGDAPECSCDYGFSQSTDFGWDPQTQSWTGSCTAAKCPANCRAEFVKCTCDAGYVGTISWDKEKREFHGQCIQTNCPEFSVGDDCTCVSGYVGLPTWNGTFWEHTCDAVDCPIHTERKALDKGGYVCACVPPYKGNPAWTGTQWDDRCVEVSCPPFSTVRMGDPTVCDCFNGFRGNVRWAPSLQNYDSICLAANCPAPSVGQGGSCECPPGYTGDCAWRGGADGEWDCNCGPQDCPANAHFNEDIKFCTCNKGYTGTLSWNEAIDNYKGECVRVPCSQNVEHSINHPECECNIGYAGIVEWDDVNDVYTGSCQAVACPALSENHPTCSCLLGYRAKNNKQEPIKWNNKLDVWEGGCEPIPCPLHAGDNPPHCDCQKGYSPNGLDVQGDEWVGVCEKKNCPNNMGTHPHCNCTVGYFGYIQWNQATHSYSSTCTVAACPDHSSEPTKCTCNAGYEGQPLWNPATQSWAHSCPAVPCPPNSSGHPNCLCNSGFNGRITWIPETQTYEGECTMIPCPSGSRRRSTKTDGALIVGCECFTGCAGGYDWFTTSYTGGCKCKSCPRTGDCGKLMLDPATLDKHFPCVFGWSGRVRWDGVNWQDECSKVECPANSGPHPRCACNPGYRGEVTFASPWDETALVTSSSYESTCTFVSCPDSSMIRTVNPQGQPICTCQRGFEGIATWDAETQSFTGSMQCVEVACSDKMMLKNEDKSQCYCPTNFVGKNDWAQESQTYKPAVTCVQAACPDGATCNSIPDKRQCDVHYTGHFEWDLVSQSWIHNCELASCVKNSVRRPFVDGQPAGCICHKGFGLNPIWMEATQQYVGCDQNAECPTDADVTVVDETTNGRLCSCMPGFVGTPAWDAEKTAFTHTCKQLPCPFGAERKANTLCDCTIGHTGALEWSFIKQQYTGECKVAECPGDGADCEHLPTAGNTQVVCLAGYDRMTIWNEGDQSWINDCTLVACPVNTVRLDDSHCACSWGFAGAVQWHEETRSYVSTCQRVACPPPSVDTGNGHCACPRSSNGNCEFKDDDQWHCACSQLLDCQLHSTGSTECVCDVGYSGVLSVTVELEITDQPQTSLVEFSSTRVGSCSAVECPVNSLDGSFPKCSCGSGYFGAITWVPVSQTWSSTCAVAACPAHAEGGPSCACKKGYLGKLSFNLQTQQWEGECTLATCPTNAVAGFAGAVPTCNCDVGYAGVASWIAGVGWTHVCTLVNCPPLSNKIPETSIAYERLGNFMGCHDGDKNLGFVGTGYEILHTERCIGAGQDCIDLATRACEKVVEQGGECWGFAVNPAWGTQIYNFKAENKVLCDKSNGLLPNPDWVAFRRETSRKGDCECVSGYKGQFVWRNMEYVGTCSPADCPANADCTTTVDCHDGYSGSKEFTWDKVYEKWIGGCKLVSCCEHCTSTAPSCQCGAGYKGQQTWDNNAEIWTGQCTAEPCPTNSDGNFPTCKCNKGFVRSDGVANSIIPWVFETQNWKHSCSAVTCPDFADKSVASDCVCRIGYRGFPEFDMQSATYIVNQGSSDQRSCVKTACPAHSTERGLTVGDVYTPSCHCDVGYKGELSWNPVSATWGECSIVACPSHSSGHPHCSCEAGYEGQIDWKDDHYLGTCREINVNPTWETVAPAASTGACIRLRGPRDSMAMETKEDDGSTSFTFSFGGSSTDTSVDSVTILRCEMKLWDEFTKVKGQFDVVPLTQSIVANNYQILQWNSSAVSSKTQYIASGTPYNIVDPGMESESLASMFATPRTITLHEASVTLTNTVRFEISQLPGVSLKLRNFRLETYNLPQEVVKCTRTTEADK